MAIEFAEGINAKADVQKTTSKGHMALILACQKGHDQCALALINAKADPEKVGHDANWTALMCASGNGHKRCVLALISAKADLDKQKADGMAALMLACQNGNDQCAQRYQEW